MKTKVVGCVLLGLALVLSLGIGAHSRDRDDQECRDSENHQHNVKTLDQIVGVIPIPDKPLVSSDIAWADSGTERFYLSDRSNAGIDIIDAENDTWAGRVTSGPGNAHFAGTPGTDGQGPDGVLVTPGKKLWAGDGSAQVQEADVDPASTMYLQIIHTISLVDPATSECDNGTIHHCSRADEVGWDPKHHVLLAAVDQPTLATNALNCLDTTTSPATPVVCPAHPYAALIDASTPFPYKVTIVPIPNITPGGGLEQPLWDPELNHDKGGFFLTVPSITGGGGEIAIIDPKTGVVGAYKTPNCGPTGEVLAPFQHLVVECGGNLLVLNALTGNLIATIPNVGADELWFNPGDDRIYSGNSDVLSVVDAETNTLLQKLPAPGARNQAAFAENNHVFVPIRVTSAQVTDSTKDMSTCNQFGVTGHGCIAVAIHSEKEEAPQETDNRR